MQNDDWATTIKGTFTMFTTNQVFEETYYGVKQDYSAGVPQFPTGGDVINEFNKNYGLVSFMGHGAPCNVAVATTGWNDEPPGMTKHRIYTVLGLHSLFISC